MAEIVLDVDGVILDLMSVYIDWVYIYEGKRLKYEDIDEWQEGITNSAWNYIFSGIIPPYSGVQESLHRFQELRHTVTFLTKRTYNNALKSLMKSILDYDLVCNRLVTVMAWSEKDDYIASAKPDVFVEDNGEYVAKAKPPKETKLLIMDRPWNRSYDLDRIYKLEEVLDYV